MDVQEVLKAEGRPVEARWEAAERWRAGERLFALSDAGDAPQEIETHEQLNAAATHLLRTLETDSSRWRIAFLPRLAAHDLRPDLSQIHRYESVEELAKKAAGSRTWAMGETFVVEEGDRFVIAHQLAPSSCEMAVISHNGWHDVVTAYRVGSAPFAAQLNHFLEAPLATQSMSGPRP